jgi:tight adherence protein C
MTPEGTITLVVFLMASSAVLLAWTLIGGRRARVDARLDVLSGRVGGGAVGGLPGDPPTTMAKFARDTLPRMGTALVPTDEEERSQLKGRLINAGFYGRQAMAIFLGVKMILMVAPAGLGFAAAVAGLLPMQPAVLGGACLGILGMIGPSFWLDKKKAARQSTFRRALPDALDVLVICLEGGLSLPSALKKISGELRSAHPELSAELNVVQREILLGRAPGDALQQMGIRTDLEEVRGLASVITQSERFGASLVKSLRVHSETLRTKRQQRAEEMGQKASTKVLFPTLLFIFPAIFVVILGPAAVQIMRTMGSMGK